MHGRDAWFFRFFQILKENVYMSVQSTTKSMKAFEMVLNLLQLEHFERENGPSQGHQYCTSVDASIANRYKVVLRRTGLDTGDQYNPLFCLDFDDKSPLTLAHVLIPTFQRMDQLDTQQLHTYGTKSPPTGTPLPAYNVFVQECHIHHMTNTLKSYVCAIFLTPAGCHQTVRPPK